MHKLAGVKLRTFSNSKLSNFQSLTLELSSSTGCFKLQLQTFAAVEFDRPSKFESLRLWKFASSTVRRFQTLKVRMFEGLKVRKFESSKVRSLKGWLQIRSAASGCGREFESSKVSNFEWFQVPRVDSFRDRKFERDETSRV